MVCAFITIFNTRILMAKKHNITTQTKVVCAKETPISVLTKTKNDTNNGSPLFNFETIQTEVMVSANVLIGITKSIIPITHHLN